MKEWIIFKNKFFSPLERATRAKRTAGSRIATRESQLGNRSLVLPATFLKGFFYRNRICTNAFHSGAYSF
jgi:hypothetical protein